MPYRKWSINRWRYVVQRGSTSQARKDEDVIVNALYGFLLLIGYDTGISGQHAFTLGYSVWQTLSVRGAINEFTIKSCAALFSSLGFLILLLLNVEGIWLALTIWVGGSLTIFTGIWSEWDKVLLKEQEVVGKLSEDYSCYLGDAYVLYQASRVYASYIKLAAPDGLWRDVDFETCLENRRFFYNFAHQHAIPFSRIHPSFINGSISSISLRRWDALVKYKSSLVAAGVWSWPKGPLREHWEQCSKIIIGPEGQADLSSYVGSGLWLP